MRIGLSATQKPIDEVARFLVGAGAVVDGRADCEIVDIGYAKQRDLALELPPTPLAAVMSNDQWEQVYGRVAELVHLHRTTLVFVNTRRMAERAARHLGERLGKEAVAAHHGSLAKEARLDAEQRLKRGDLKVLVATASLELGLDIGDVDLVCQLGSPRSIATFLQRAGRSGHAVGGVPKARLFPQSRDELVECAALLDAVRRGELDALRIVPAPLDVLAQQIVAETASREWDEDELFALVRRAWPYARARARRLRRRRAHARRRLHDAPRPARELRPPRRRPPRPAREEGRAPGRAHLGRHDPRERRLRRRPRAAEHATSAPSTRTSRSRASPATSSSSATRATASCASSPAASASRTRTARRRASRSGSAKRRGAATSCRSAVARLRDEVGARIARRRPRGGDRPRWCAEVGLDDEAARQIVDHLARALAVLGALPTQERIVIERFFDASGGMQLVVHSPFGSRLNRAWGLALSKRFCRRFNFEIQAAATEDAIVLSLSTSHSFPLDEVVALPAFGDRARRARPGAARRAALRRALALERDHRAGVAALHAAARRSRRSCSG